MESGSSITGNTSIKATHGGGVYNEGTFTMNGGTISGNLARLAGPRDNQIGGDGGGVYNKGTFTMNDGTISTNKAMDGGAGVYNNSGTFTMNNGTISGNGVQSGSNRVFAGAGVMNRGTFDMYNGTISGNESTYYGGGVYNVVGTFTMHDGTISGNSAATSETASTTDGGGGVFVAGTVELLGGTITGNTVVKSGTKGSGVYVNSASGDTFKMGGSAKVNSSNDVYLSGSSKIIISGALTAQSPVATITPATCKMNVTVLGGTAALIEANRTQFALSDSTYTINKNGNVWKDDLASLTEDDMKTLIDSDDAKTSSDLIMQKTSGEDGSKQWRHMIGTKYVVKTTAGHYCTLEITGITNLNTRVQTSLRLAGETTVRSWYFTENDSDIDSALGGESGNPNARNDIHVGDGKPHNSAKFYIMEYVYNP